VLQNPGFAGGSATSWLLESGWTVGGSGTPPNGGTGYAGVFTGPGTAAIRNTTHIACNPGEVIKGQCWALGELTATGAAAIRITFYDKNGSEMDPSTSAPWVSNNYVWIWTTVFAVTPLNAAYAQVEFAVFNSTGASGGSGGSRWFVTGFFGANLLGTGRRLLSLKQPMQYYLNLFTSQYRMSPKLNAWQAALLQPLDDLSNCLQTFNISYDIDNAIGSQLDVLGQIIGVSRTLPFQPSNGVSPILDDDTYRLLLYATQIKNTWDGTIESLYKAWQFLFPNGVMAILDNQNMTATITTSGNFTSIEQDLITKGYIIPRPEGVQYNPSGSGTTSGLFGFDRNDSTVAGFDVGKFA